MKSLVERIADLLGCSAPQAKLALDAVLLAIQEQATRLRLRGFGTFEVKNGRRVFRAAKNGHQH